MRKLFLIMILLLFLSGCLQRWEMEKVEEFKVVKADEKNFRYFVTRLESGGYSYTTFLNIKKSPTPLTL